MLLECSAHDFAEAIFADGLEEIVEGVHFERADCVLIVGGDEDKARRAAVARIAVGRNGAHDVEAVGAGHLHIDKDEIGAVLFDGGDRGLGVVGFADDFDVGFVAEETEQFATRGSFVVDDENAKKIRRRHHQS